MTESIINAHTILTRSFLGKFKPLPFIHEGSVHIFHRPFLQLLQLNKKIIEFGHYSKFNESEFTLAGFYLFCDELTRLYPKNNFLGQDERMSLVLKDAKKQMEAIKFSHLRLDENRLYDIGLNFIKESDDQTKNFIKIVHGLKDLLNGISHYRLTKRIQKRLAYAPTYCRLSVGY